MNFLAAIIDLLHPDKLTEQWLGTKDEFVDIPDEHLAGYRAYDAANPDRFKVEYDKEGKRINSPFTA